uniref:NADH-ubiquinone oxidoreductase chain 6 n=1 Tax=Anaedus unidentatus TaxID=2984367 RepID=A0A978B0N3_9CUCU|nr:NADH dehydrogenase subunit 6 [Anaedus unidentatus]UYB79079.1 NADH dehydrogenase subunit 6 [Anaedus unidentatus]
MMIKLYLMSTLTFLFMNHPLSMGLLLLLQTLITSFITSNMYMNFWYSYILMLIMIGGMLILFIYMTSIASNEKFSLKPKTLLMIPISIMISFMFQKNLNFLFNSSETVKTLSINKFLIPMIKFLNFPNIIILLFIIIFLFVILVATVKISKKTKGPLRHMFN